MTTYLLSLYQPDGPPPPPEILDPIVRDLAELNDEMRAAGVWVFAGGLFPPSTATVVRPGDGPLLTDGPFAEGREVLGGITVIEAEDLDEALTWGARLAEASTLPVEIRPFRPPSSG